MRTEDHFRLIDADYVRSQVRWCVAAAVVTALGVFECAYWIATLEPLTAKFAATVVMLACGWAHFAIVREAYRWWRLR